VQRAFARSPRFPSFKLGDRRRGVGVEVAPGHDDRYGHLAVEVAPGHDDRYGHLAVEVARGTTTATGTSPWRSPGARRPLRAPSPWRSRRGSMAWRRTPRSHRSHLTQREQRKWVAAVRPGGQRKRERDMGLDDQANTPRASRLSSSTSCPSRQARGGRGSGWTRASSPRLTLVARAEVTQGSWPPVRGGRRRGRGSCARDLVGWSALMERNVTGGRPSATRRRCELLWRALSDGNWSTGQATIRTRGDASSDGARYARQRDALEPAAGRPSA
jgi:hypothetical protein